MTDQPETEFPLPPPEVVAEMIATEATTPAPTLPPAAKLNFVGGKAWSTTVPLDFPFDLEGRVVEEVSLHRLTTAEMGEIVDRLGTTFTRWDMVAAMSGLPVEVLRGMEAGDGDRVMEAGFHFLPHSLKG